MHVGFFVKLLLCEKKYSRKHCYTTTMQSRFDLPPLEVVPLLLFVIDVDTLILILIFILIGIDIDVNLDIDS